jgi:hypothetical protein
LFFAKPVIEYAKDIGKGYYYNAIHKFKNMANSAPPPLIGQFKAHSNEAHFNFLISYLILG